jgi:hypothetical protein
MPVSHAPVPSRALNAAEGQVRVPGLLEVLAQVADPRKRRGRRLALAFTLAVAVVCVLAGARSFREIGDQAADLPQDMLAALGGVPCPLRRRIPVPGEKRIPTLLQDLDGGAMGAVVGGWLRSLAAAGNPARPQGGPPGHVAIDGKWLRGVGDGPVKLFAALHHGDGVIIAQHRIPDGTTETTQVKALPGPVDLTGTVVTADAAADPRNVPHPWLRSICRRRRRWLLRRLSHQLCRVQLGADHLLEHEVMVEVEDRPCLGGDNRVAAER